MAAIHVGVRYLPPPRWAWHVPSACTPLDATSGFDEYARTSLLSRELLLSIYTGREAHSGRFISLCLCLFCFFGHFVLCSFCCSHILSSSAAASVLYTAQVHMRMDTRGAKVDPGRTGTRGSFHVSREAQSRRSDPPCWRGSSVLTRILRGGVERLPLGLSARYYYYSMQSTRYPSVNWHLCCLSLKHTSSQSIALGTHSHRRKAGARRS